MPSPATRHQAEDIDSDSLVGVSTAELLQNLPPSCFLRGGGKRKSEAGRRTDDQPMVTSGGDSVLLADLRELLSSHPKAATPHPASAQDNDDLDFPPTSVSKRQAKRHNMQQQQQSRRATDRYLKL